MDAVVSSELMQNAALAVLIAFAGMLIYIAWRFEFWFALAAIIAIFHDILVTVGLASILWLQIDSASVAAILTIAAYSVHDTIVIFDRIRENVKMRKKGEPLDELIHHSIMQTLGRSINTVVAVIFCLLALILLRRGHHPGLHDHADDRCDQRGVLVHLQCQPAVVRFQADAGRRGGEPLILEVRGSIRGKIFVQTERLHNEIDCQLIVRPDAIC